jgi:cytochrome c peroxidase
MLPTDIALINDVEFRKFVQRYAEDINIFFLEFSAAYVKLLELGVPYLQNGAQPRLEFKRRN